MRQGQQKQRMRGRGGRKMPNPHSRVYESNGPDVKVRGTAAHIAEKYLNLARDAQSSGDPVAGENYMQHAEHYLRIIAATQPLQQPQPQNSLDGADGDEDDFPTTNSVATQSAARGERGESAEGDEAEPHDAAADGQGEEGPSRQGGRGRRRRGNGQHGRADRRGEAVNGAGEADGEPAGIVVNGAGGENKEDVAAVAPAVVQDVEDAPERLS